MTSPLKQMLHNAEEMILAELDQKVVRRFEVIVKVTPRGTVGREVGHWQVSVRFVGRGPLHPTEMTLKFDGMLSLGQLATSAAEFIRKAM